MRVTRYDKEKIVYLLKYRMYNELVRQGNPEVYRIGVSSDVVPMLEFDYKDIIVALDFTRKLCELSGHFAVLSRTDRGYHIIVLAELYNPIISVRLWTGIVSTFMRRYEWKWSREYIEEARRINRMVSDIAYNTLRDWRLNWYEFYNEMLRWIDENLHNSQYLDRQHITMSLKRHYTTLRISGKPCKKYDIKPYLLVFPDKTYYGYSVKLLDVIKPAILKTVKVGLLKWFESTREIIEVARYPDVLRVLRQAVSRVELKLREMGVL